MVDRRSTGTGNGGEDKLNEPVAVHQSKRRRLRSAENEEDAPSTSTTPAAMGYGERTEPTGLNDVPESSVEYKLPSRVFAMDCYPEPARLNIYSKANVIGGVAEALAGTEALETLLGSQFRQLFMLPVARCHNSGKLIHSILARQLITKKKYELWSVFGGKPIRFSIREFQRVSGLICSKIPEGHSLVHVVPKKRSRTWKDLFGVDCKKLTVEGALKKLKDKNLDDRKRLPLALIILVDGVLVTNKTLKITPAYVDMLEDVQSFLQFPWGRLSFIKTLSRFGQEPLSPKNPVPLEKLKKRLRQQTSACYGFPLALQLVALEAIPLLLEKIPDPTKTATFTEEPTACDSAITLLQVEDILDVEANPKLTVEVDVTDDHNADLEWDDEAEDEEVDHMVEMLREGHVFKPHEFGGGDSSDLPVPVQTEGETSSRGGQTAAAASKTKRIPHQRTQRENPERRVTRSSQRETTKENVRPGENMAYVVEELKAWISGQLRNLMEELVDYIDNGNRERSDLEVKEREKEKERERQKKKENVSRKRKGKEKEGEGICEMEYDVVDVTVVGDTEKGKYQAGEKTGTTLRRSSRLKRNENAASGSVDLPSLQKQEEDARGNTSRQKKRKLVFEVPNLQDEDFNIYDDIGNRSPTQTQLGDRNASEGQRDADVNAEEESAEQQSDNQVSFLLPLPR